MQYDNEVNATNVVINYKKLESFLAYLEDKTDDVYEREVQQAIERFLKEEITLLKWFLNMSKATVNIFHSKNNMIKISKFNCSEE